jgi:tetratricopeptide (TPR) repeat protein
MKYYLTLFLIAVGMSASVSASAAYHYTLTAPVNEAYQLILDMRLTEARAKLKTIQTQDPNNLLTTYFDNYIDFLVCFIGEQSADYDRLAAQADKRAAILSKGPASSPYKLFTQAQVRIQLAVAGAKFGKYVAAFREVNNAYGNLSINRERFPDFMPNLMSIGVIHAAVGYIPDNYKWGVTMLTGMDGSMEQGLKELEQVVSYGEKHPEFIFREESLVMYAYLILLLQNDSKKAWNLVNNPAVLDPTKSPLACFAMSSVAWRNSMNEKVISLCANQPKGASYYPIHFNDYMLGLAKLQKLDADGNVAIERFLTNFKGKFYIKEAWQRLSWHYLIKGNMTEFERCRKNTVSQGTATTGADKSAFAAASSKLNPDVTLIKARLLFDGGYHDRAAQVLSGKSEATFAAEEHKQEFLYRQGRIFQKTGKSAEAIKSFQSVIARGKSTNTYFACAGAYHLGTVFEQQGNKTQAIASFKQCLSIKPVAFAESLHALAKSGLSRLK